MEFERYELVYKINKNETHLRLLGEEFYQRNKIFGHFIHNNRKFRLIEKVETKNIKENKLEIELIFYKIIYNKSYMFKDCESLLQFSLFNDDKDKNYYSQIINIHEEEENLLDYYDENKISEKTLPYFME